MFSLNQLPTKIAGLPTNGNFLNIKKITDEHKIKAALAIAGLIKSPKSGKIIPDALDKRVVKAVAGVFKK